MATFIVDPPVHLLLGLLFGALAPRQRPWSSRALRAGLVADVAFTVSALVSYAVAPDWMWGYLVTPGDVAWAVPLLPLGFAALFLGGFAAALGARARGRGHLIAGLAGAAALEVAVLALTWDRYRFVGSATEWAAGTAAPLLTLAPTGDARVVGLVAPAFLAVLAAAVAWTWREKRAAAPGR